MTIDQNCIDLEYSHNVIYSKSNCMSLYILGSNSTKLSGKSSVFIFPIQIGQGQLKFKRTFKRALKTMVHFIWHVMTERLFSLPLTKVGIHFGHVRMCATPCPISLIIFILDLGPSYTDKLLEFRWVQIAHLS